MRIVLLIFTAAYMLQSEESRPVQLGLDKLYDGIPLDEHLLRLDKQALDEAYRDQLKKLFSVWMSSQAGDSTNFRNGLKLARRAYNQVVEQIEKRREELIKKQQVH